VERGGSGRGRGLSGSTLLSTGGPVAVPDAVKTVVVRVTPTLTPRAQLSRPLVVLELDDCGERMCESLPASGCAFSLCPENSPVDSVEAPPLVLQECVRRAARPVAHSYIWPLEATATSGYRAAAGFAQGGATECKRIWSEI
jgi:hypothetical protein